MARWGNALGGWRRQRRDRKGRFTSSGKAAKATYKATKKRNAAGHRSRTRGSIKARGRELRTNGPRRAQNIIAGGATAGVGHAIGSNALRSRGLQQARYGVSASYGRTTATRKMSKGLKKSRNRKAKKQYQAAIGSTRTTRAIRNGVVVATTAGLGYAAYRNGNIRLDRDVQRRSAGVTIQGRGRMATANMAKVNDGFFMGTYGTHRGLGGYAMGKGGFTYVTPKKNTRTFTARRR